MNTEGGIFLASFLPMVVLIVWTIWGIASDKKKGITYFPVAEKISEKSGVTSAGWRDLVWGVLVALSGASLYLFLNRTHLNPLDNAAFQQETVATGIALMGFWIIFRWFKLF